MPPSPLISTLFPYTTLFRSLVNLLLDLAGPNSWPGSSLLLVPPRDAGSQPLPNPELRGLITTSICVRVLSEWGSRRCATCRQDRKSTRLNSSHVSISYAVFC